MSFIRHSRRFFPSLKIKNVEKKSFATTVTDDYLVKSAVPDIEIPNYNVTELLTPCFNKFEKFVALECAVTKRKVTFGEIRDKSAIFAKFLRKILKLEEGDVVALILRNFPDYAIVDFGVMNANLVLTAVSPAFTAEEMSRQLIDSGAKIVITEASLHNNVETALKIARKKLPTIVIKTEMGQSLPRNTIDFHEILDSKIDYPEILPCNPDNIALLPYSSGTTGIPKGVELTHRNLVSNTLQSIACDTDYQTEASESYQELVPAIIPYYHSLGHCILKGASVIGAKMITMPVFTPELFLSVLKNYKSTIQYLVPPLVLMVTYSDDVKKEYLENVKAIISGGAPLAASDEQKFIQKFGDKICLAQGYGLTETSPTTTSLHPRIMTNIDSYRGSIGKPVPNTITKIVNPDDPKNTPLGPNTTGELMIKGPQVMKGYRNLPEETKKVLTEDGWLRSGDLGHFNDDGFLFITDRLKELIKVKGNQVAPAELEGVIRSFPGVADAAVIGVPHETSGEVPRAYVVGGENFDVEKLREFVNERVARYKQLKGGIVVVDTIPKNPSGKILRREIKEKYLNEMSSS